MATTAFDSTSPYDVLSPVTDSPTDSAATTDDVDVDASTDDSVGDSGSDDVDAEASSSDESSDAADSDQDSDSDQSADGDQDAEAAKKAEDTAWAAKDGNIPAALKEILAANPAHAARLKQMYFTNQRLMKFGTQSEIRKMKEAVEAVGGHDKLINLKNKIDTLGGEQGFEETIADYQAYKGLDQQWMNGDSGFVDHLAQTNPASFETLAPVFFGKLADVNSDLYNNIGSRIIDMTLKQDGTYMNFQMATQALGAGNAALAKQYMDKIGQRLAGIEQMANQAPTRKAGNPQQKAWDTEKQQYEQRETERFQADLVTANVGWMNPKINNELSTYLGGGEKKLSQNTLTRLERAIKEDIWNNHLMSNQQFVKQREALLAKRDKDGLVRLYKQYAPDKVWQKATRDIVEEFGIKPAGKKTAAAAAPKTNGATQQQKTEGGFAKVTKFPRPDEVDNSRTTFDMKVKNQFHLKDGRKIQVVEPKAQ